MPNFAVYDIKTRKRMKKKEIVALEKETKPRPLNWTQKSQVYRIVNSNTETKFYDFTTTLSQQFGLAGLTTDLTAIPATAAGIFPGRVGEQISPTALEFRFSTYAQNTSPNFDVRVSIIQWRPDNAGASAPAMATVFDTNASLGATQFIWSPFNFNGRHLYTVLYDKLYTMQGNTASAFNNRNFKVILPLRKKTAKVNYGPAVNTGDHHIYIIYQTNIASGANGALLSAYHRIYYKDG